MEAYKVMLGTKVKVIDESVITPPGSTPVRKNDKITMGRLDGMYCKGTNDEGLKVYIAAWTEVEPEESI